VPEAGSTVRTYFMYSEVNGLSSRKASSSQWRFAKVSDPSITERRINGHLPSKPDPSASSRPWAVDRSHCRKATSMLRNVGFWQASSKASCGMASSVVAAPRLWLVVAGVPS
jgi:hypothetical protein